MRFIDYLCIFMCVNRACSCCYISYLDDVFWSTEFKVHSIDGEGNGWQTVYFTTVKCVLGRGGGKGRREGKEGRGKRKEGRREGEEGGGGGEVEEENERRMTEK